MTTRAQKKGQPSFASRARRQARRQPKNDLKEAQLADLRISADLRQHAAHRLISLVRLERLPVFVRRAEAEAILLRALSTGWDEILAAILAIERGLRGRWRPRGPGYRPYDEKLTSAFIAVEYVIRHGIETVGSVISAYRANVASPAAMEWEMMAVRCEPPQLPVRKRIKGSGQAMRALDHPIDVALDFSGPLPRLLLSERMICTMAAYGTEAIEAVLERVPQEVIDPHVDQATLKLAINRWLTKPSGLSEERKAIRRESEKFQPNTQQQS
jgi:hypothetical protein